MFHQGRRHTRSQHKTHLAGSLSSSQPGKPPCSVISLTFGLIGRPNIPSFPLPTFVSADFSQRTSKNFGNPYLTAGIRKGLYLPLNFMTDLLLCLDVMLASPGLNFFQFWDINERTTVYGYCISGSPGRTQMNNSLERTL